MGVFIPELLHVRLGASVPPAPHSAAGRPRHQPENKIHQHLILLCSKEEIAKGSERFREERESCRASRMIQPENKIHQHLILLCSKEEIAKGSERFREERESCRASRMIRLHVM
jgi:hypothetical protein